MSASKAVDYRVALAAGFLGEAEQDFTLERWRSCVDNAQLAVENAGKAALALFGLAPKTHDPARQIAVVLREQELPAAVSELLHAMLPDLLVLGTEAHFLTDYGDEDNYTLPWRAGQNISSGWETAQNISVRWRGIGSLGLGGLGPSATGAAGGALAIGVTSGSRGRAGRFQGAGQRPARRLWCGRCGQCASVGRFKRR